MLRFTLAIVALAFATLPACADAVKIPKSVIAAVWDKAECTNDLKELDANNGYEAQPLSGKLVLVEVYCWRAAYQSGSIFFAVDPAAPDKAQLLQFPIWHTAWKRLGTTYSLTDPTYDPKTKTLGMAHKGRGVGDCGEAGSWKWDGKAFRLTGFWSKPKCDGEPFDDGEQKWRVYPPEKKR
jgi:Protein of unknown function (DUF1176)